MKGGAPFPSTIYIRSGFSLKCKIGLLARVGHLGQWFSVTKRREPNHRKHFQSFFMVICGNILVSVVSFNTMISLFWPSH